MSNWVYGGEDIDVFEIPEAVGFVYLITNTVSGKRYIGKKLFHFSKTTMKTVTLKNGTKKKKKIKSKVDSDWRTYHGSSANLLADVEALGEETFSREILYFCPNKATMSYYEIMLQIQSECLYKQNFYYNGIINCRIHHSHLKPIVFPKRLFPL